MFQYLRLVGPVCLYGLLALTLLRPLPALAASAAEIDREVDTAVQTLYNNVPVAPTLVAQARGILVFPKVVKGGFLVGGEYGEGALRLGGQTVGYYNIAAVSYGLQAGLQDFGYALVFMTECSSGWRWPARCWLATPWLAANRALSSTCWASRPSLR